MRAANLSITGFDYSHEPCAKKAALAPESHQRRGCCEKSGESHQRAVGGIIFSQLRGPLEVFSQ